MTTTQLPVVLADLRNSAPRSFDKTLIDIMYALQLGRQPIVEAAAPVPAYDDAALVAKVETLEQRIAAANMGDIHTVLLMMAEKINALEMKVFDLEMRIDPIETANRLLAAEAAKRMGAAA